MNEKKYNEYDKIIANGLSYFLTTEDEKFRIDYFNPLEEKDLLTLYLMFISKGFKNRPIYISMKPFSYIKFKIKNKFFRKIVKYKKLPSDYTKLYDSCYHLLKIFPTNSSFSEIDKKSKEIYEAYYKGE